MQLRPFRATLPKLDHIESFDNFFATVKEDFSSYQKKGFFKRLDLPAIYIYNIKTKLRNYTGIIGCNALSDYQYGHIKLHELTLHARRETQVELLEQRKAAVKPVLLTYPPVKAIRSWINNITQQNEPVLRIMFEKEKQEHEIWAVTDSYLLGDIIELFQKDVPVSYIADGHHRTAASNSIYQSKAKPPYDQLLCAYFDTDQLDVLEFNRIVRLSSSQNKQELLSKLSSVFDISRLEEAEKPDQKHQINLFTQDQWFKLKWKTEVLEAFSEETVLLDTMLLNEKVLKEILGIENAQTDNRIDYVEGPKDLSSVKKKTLKKSDNIAFVLHPMTLEEVLVIANEKKVLPPKSSWFEPRMKNGLVVFEYQEI